MHVPTNNTILNSYNHIILFLVYLCCVCCFFLCHEYFSFGFCTILNCFHFVCDKKRQQQHRNNIKNFVFYFLYIFKMTKGTFADRAHDNFHISVYGNLIALLNENKYKNQSNNTLDNSDAIRHFEYVLCCTSKSFFYSFFFGTAHCSKERKKIHHVHTIQRKKLEMNTSEK